MGHPTHGINDVLLHLSCARRAAHSSVDMMLRKYAGRIICARSRGSAYLVSVTILQYVTDKLVVGARSLYGVVCLLLVVGVAGVQNTVGESPMNVVITKG